MANHNPNNKQHYQFGNIIREVAVDLSSEDFDPVEVPFFIRVETAGYLTYWPVDNTEGELVTRYFDQSYYFNDPIACRKIAKNPNTSPDTYASNVYIGYGV